MSELIRNAGHTNKMSTLATFSHLRLAWKIDPTPAVQQSRYGQKNGLMDNVTTSTTYQALKAYVLLIGFNSLCAFDSLLDALLQVLCFLLCRGHELLTLTRLQSTVLGS